MKNAKSSAPSIDHMQEWIENNQSIWLEEYFQFLRYPSISSESEYAERLDACKEWLLKYLQNMGFETQTWPTSGHPVIFASMMDAGPNQPTLLIYNHYDVQPVDPIDEWTTPPFEPSIRNGEVYARGAQDNKGQCFYVLQGLKLLKEQMGSLPINIKLCIEGEEEIGSAGLAQILSKKRDLLTADYLAIVDVGLRKADHPALTLGIRGILTLDVELQGSASDLHSGSHGGIVYNPIHALVELLASLRDAGGTITVPDFYKNVKEITEKETSKLSFQFDAEEYYKETQAYPTGGEKKFSALESAWIRPTLEINGIHGGYTGKGFKTVIPAKAYAKISCRLVPDQDPHEIGKILADYLKTYAPKEMSVVVDIHPGQGKPVRVSPNAQVVKAFSQSLEEVFGSPCEYIFEGASIPIVPELAKACGGETILLGLGLGTDLIHAPNEHFGIDRLKKGMMVIARAIAHLTQFKS